MILAVAMMVSLAMPMTAFAAAITAVTYTPVEGLQEGNDNVKAGATVATLGTTGGDTPITYALIPDQPLTAMAVVM